MARNTEGQRKHWLRVKALAEKIGVTPRLVQFHWSKVKQLESEIYKGDKPSLIQAVGICEDQEDYGEELCTIAAWCDCKPSLIRKHVKLLAPMRERLLAGDQSAVEFVKALVSPATWIVKPGDPGTKVIPGTAESGIIDQLVEEKLDKMRKSDTKAHFQIMSWAVEKIGSVELAEKALAAVKVMAS